MFHYHESGCTSVYLQTHVRCYGAMVPIGGSRRYIVTSTPGGRRPRLLLFLDMKLFSTEHRRHVIVSSLAEHERFIFAVVPGESFIVPFEHGASLEHNFRRKSRQLPIERQEAAASFQCRVLVRLARGQNQQRAHEQK